MNSNHQGQTDQPTHGVLMAKNTLADRVLSVQFRKLFLFHSEICRDGTHTQNTKHQTPNSIVLFFDFFEPFLYFVLVESRFSPDEHHDVLGSPEDRPRLPQPPLPAGVSLFSHDESPLGAPLYRARWMAPNQPRVELPKDDDEERARARNIFNTKMEQGKKNNTQKRGKSRYPPLVSSFYAHSNEF